MKTLYRKATSLRGLGKEAGISVLDAVVAVGAMVILAGALVANPDIIAITDGTKTTNARASHSSTGSGLPVLLVGADGQQSYLGGANMTAVLDNALQSLQANGHTETGDLCYYVIEVSRDICPGGTNFAGSLEGFDQNRVLICPNSSPPPVCVNKISATMGPKDCKVAMGCVYHSMTGEVDHLLALNPV